MDDFNENFMQSVASNLRELHGRFASAANEGEEAMENMISSMTAPMEVTRAVKSRISALPVSQSLTLYVHINYETLEEGTNLMCAAHVVTKSRGSNGASIPDSDGIGESLAYCALHDAGSSDVHASKMKLLLGTLAKACLEPMMGFCGVSVAGMRERYPPSRPRKVLFTTRGEVHTLSRDLKKMGILDADVADHNLVQSCEIFASSQNMPSPDDPGDLSVMTDISAMAQRMMLQSEGPYVSEEFEPLGGWSPPNEPGDFPREWYARPPIDPISYRPTALCGWRTNLERAVLGEDADMVMKIKSKYNAADIREYVECRMLLTKTAQRGLIKACKLLIEECGASVEGIQGSDGHDWWKDIQNKSGNCCDLTPLHQAARNGKLESCKLLLDYGADVNRIDRANIKASPLHHAISAGEIDCVRLLCERGADHTYEGQGGEALDISELMGQGDTNRHRVQVKIQQILREFDTRCSYCREPDASKRCPCGKERYCDVSCQKQRWKPHKKYHKEVVGVSSVDQS